MARPPFDAERLQAAALLTGLDMSASRSRDLCNDAERLFRLYDRLMEHAPGDVPPATTFRVEPRHPPDL